MLDGHRSQSVEFDMTSEQNSSKALNFKVKASSMAFVQEFAKSSVWYFILPYLPALLVIRLQILNRKFYNVIVPNASSRLNSLGSVSNKSFNR